MNAKHVRVLRLTTVAFTCNINNLHGESNIFFRRTDSRIRAVYSRGLLTGYQKCVLCRLSVRESTRP